MEYTKFLKNKNVKRLFFIFLFTLSIATSFSLGYEEGRKKPQTYIISGIKNLEENKPEDVDFSLFWEAWRVLKEKHINAPKINNQDFVYSSIAGLFSALKDPNTVFFKPDDAKKFGEDISGQFSGIGAEIGIKNEQLTVITPLKNSPAEKAGLKAGDKILEIDEKNTQGLTVEEAVKLIRGEKGTTVTLKIYREKWKEPQKISIIRNIVQIPTIDWEMKEGKIAYIRLYNFYEKAPLLFFRTAIQIALNNPKGIILDLRNNPGGYLDAAINIAGWFLKPGEIIVKEEFRDTNPVTYKARGTGLFKDIPIVILVNEGSASASEILAGALKVNRNIKLVGKKTFGKGTVQEVVTLKNNALAKITIANWLLPDGTIIEKNGIKPDYEIDIKEEDNKENIDPQLNKAIDLLKNQIENTKPLIDFQNIKIKITTSS
jgi:carboxyl-terminal processing protease